MILRQPYNLISETAKIDYETYRCQYFKSKTELPSKAPFLVVDSLTYRIIFRSFLFTNRFSNKKQGSSQIPAVEISP